MSFKCDKCGCCRRFLSNYWHVLDSDRKFVGWGYEWKCASCGRKFTDTRMF